MLLAARALSESERLAFTAISAWMSGSVLKALKVFFFKSCNKCRNLG